MPHTPYHYPPYPYPPSRHNIMNETLMVIEPYVQYGLKEAKFTSVPHAMREVAAIAYLLGKGYDPRTAYQMVESWEIAERFPTEG